VAIGETEQGRPINRFVQTKTVKSRFTELSYKQGTADKVLTIKNDGTITTFHRIKKSQIDEWRKRLVTTH
jgi:hypothetical protein